MWTTSCFVAAKNVRSGNNSGDNIRNKFKWRTWEQDQFVQCGVRIERTPDGGFELSQSQYIDEIKEICISAERCREPKALTTEFEKTKIRAAL